MAHDDFQDVMGDIREVAANIRNLAHEIDEGRATPPDLFVYNNQYSYETLIAMLVDVNFAKAEDSDRPPTEELRARVNPLLEEIGMDIDQVYADARKGQQFMMRHIWGQMKSGPDYPPDAGVNYTMLHYSLDFLGLKPHTPEACEVLETEDRDFTRLDKSYALATIYESIMDNQMMMNMVAGKLYQQYARQGLAGQFEFAREFAQRFNNSLAAVYDDVKKIMAQSGLSQEEVQFYVTTRLEMNGVVLSGPPRYMQ
ncbi:MAG: hypothetical protein H6858_01575 [Rhodospirillales bacterium]|nr:hypothetical protein [Alphaproteobacteria bacterium]MCB9976272.1 hypothetical protein [Rhodospirillales bacterium]